MELDSEIQTSKNFKQKKKDFRICHIDETIIKVVYGLIWLWIAIEPIRKEILGIKVSI
jgi:transposase-like protein